MSCVSGLIFGVNEGVGSRFHVLRAPARFRLNGGVGSHFDILRSRSLFRRYRGRRVLLFMFCAPGLIFGGTEGVRSRFLTLRARNHFRRYQGRPISFSCFPHPDMFLAARRASGPVFMFRAPGIIFGGTEGVGSRFHVLHSLTHFRRYGEFRVPFSCFARPNSFWAVPRASGPFL
jgi:hypothetical protein